MKNLIIFTVVIALIGMTIYAALTHPYDPMLNQRVKMATSIDAVSQRSAAETESSSAISDHDTSTDPTLDTEVKTVTLVDRDYPATSTKGKDWLRSIGTVKLIGNLQKAHLYITVARGDSDRGWSAVGIYAAPFDSHGWPDESVYGNRLQFINAEWNGDCKRHLSPDSSFGVLHEHDTLAVLDLASVPTTLGSDGCDTRQQNLNLLGDVEHGLYLGFAPSSAGYHVKAELEYVGDLTVTPL